MTAYVNSRQTTDINPLLQFSFCEGLRQPEKFYRRLLVGFRDGSTGRERQIKVQGGKNRMFQYEQISDPSHDKRVYDKNLTPAGWLVPKMCCHVGEPRIPNWALCTSRSHNDHGEGKSELSSSRHRSPSLSPQLLCS